MGKIKVYAILEESTKEEGKKIFNILQSENVSLVELETEQGYILIDNPSVVVEEDEDYDWFAQVEISGDIDADYIVFRALLHMDNGALVELGIVGQEDEFEEDEKEKALAAN